VGFGFLFLRAIVAKDSVAISFLFFIFHFQELNLT